MHDIVFALVAVVLGFTLTFLKIWSIEERVDFLATSICAVEFAYLVWGLFQLLDWAAVRP